MADMKGALNKAGIKGETTERRCVDCGKPFEPKEPHHKRCGQCAQKGSSREGTVKSPTTGFFAEGYPAYFDADGLLKPEFVTELAEEIAQRLGNERPKMGMHQLRAFYGHVKLQEGALQRGRPFKEVYLEIAKLKPFASERANKDKVPKYFEQFIARNVDKVKDADTFLRGFVEHFQAVVAYCAGTIRR
jgi:CRISPR type III-A-associated protein Csm2